LKQCLPPTWCRGPARVCLNDQDSFPKVPDSLARSSRKSLQSTHVTVKTKAWVKWHVCTPEIVVRGIAYHIVCCIGRPYSPLPRQEARRSQASNVSVYWHPTVGKWEGIGVPEWMEVLSPQHCIQRGTNTELYTDFQAFTLGECRITSSQAKVCCSSCVSRSFARGLGNDSSQGPDA
jgi:hypothetical protein